MENQRNIIEGKLESAPLIRPEVVGNNHQHRCWKVWHQGTTAVQRSSRAKQQKVRISQPRSELRLLEQQFKKAREKELAGLAELRHALRKKLNTLRCAEWHRRRHRERARKCAAFIFHPFGFTEKILGQKRSGQLACTEEEVNKYRYISTTHSNSGRGNDLGPCKTLNYACEVSRGGVQRHTHQVRCTAAPPIRAFMDDLTVKATLILGCRWMDL